MKPVLTLFALLSLALTLAILYYNIKIVNRFRKDEELTATKLVIKEHVPDAFMSLSISSLFFSLGAALGAATILFQTGTFQYFSQVGVITMLVGLLTFMKRIRVAVSANDQKKTESEGKDEKEKESTEDEDADSDEFEDEKDSEEASQQE